MPSALLVALTGVGLTLGSVFRESPALLLPISLVWWWLT